MKKKTNNYVNELLLAMKKANIIGEFFSSDIFSFIE